MECGLILYFWMKWDGNFSLYKVLRNKTYVNYKYRFTDNSTVKLLEKSRGNRKYISGWRLLFDKLRCYETTLMMLMVIEYGRSYQTKDCKIGTGICCFSSNHAALRRKSKYWLAWFPDNVSKSRAKCQSVDCCFSELALSKIN
jgi:hypothetical protein